MPDTRLQVARQVIDIDKPGIITFHVYGDPGADGKQPVASTFDIDLTVLNEGMSDYLTARGFGLLASARYIGKDAQEPKVAAEGLLAEMVAGTWTPGRAAGPHEPTPFMEALAQLSNMPVHLVEEQFKDTTWLANTAKALGCSEADPSKSVPTKLRSDPRVAGAMAAIKMARAKRDADAAKAAGKSQTAPLNVGGLFGQPAQAQAAK